MGNRHFNYYSSDHKYLYYDTNNNNQSSESQKKEIFQDEKYKEASDLCRKKEFYKALRIYDELSLKYPNEYLPYVFKGDIHSILGNNKDCIIQYNKALQLNPLSPEIWTKKAEHLLKLRRFSEVIRCLENSVIVGCDGMIEQYSMTLYYLNRHEEALFIMDRSSEVKPFNEISHIIRARILVELGRYNEAKCNLKKSIVYPHVRLDAFKIYSLIYLYTNEIDKAIEFLKKASSISKSDDEVYGYRSIAILKKHGGLKINVNNNNNNIDQIIKESMKYVKKSLNIIPDNSLALLCNAMIHYINGDYNESLKIVENLMERKHGHTKFYQNELNCLISSLADERSKTEIINEYSSHFDDNLLWCIEKDVESIARKYRIGSSDQDDKIIRDKDHQLMKIKEITSILSSNLDKIKDEIRQLEEIEKEIEKIENNNS